MIQNDILQKDDPEWQFAKKNCPKRLFQMTKEWFANIARDYRKDNKNDPELHFSKRWSGMTICKKYGPKILFANDKIIICKHCERLS